MESLRGERHRNAVNDVSAAGVYNRGNLGTRREVSDWSSQFSLGFQVTCGVACEWLCAESCIQSLECCRDRFSKTKFLRSCLSPFLIQNVRPYTVLNEVALDGFIVKERRIPVQRTERVLLTK